MGEFIELVHHDNKPETKLWSRCPNNLLKKFCTIHLAGSDITATWMRKDVKTKTQTKPARETMLDKMLANSDGQSVDTMMKYYVVRTPKTDAEISTTMFNTVYGQPVEYPGAATLAKHGELYSSTMARHFRSVLIGGAKLANAQATT